MTRSLFLTAAIALLPVSAVAEGDAAAGERTFNRCKSCHMIANGDDTIVRGGRTGPNLFGVIGRAAGSDADFRYSDGVTAAGEAGLVWDGDQILEFVTNPTNFLRAYTGDDSLRSKMTPQRIGDGGADLIAFLAQFSAE